MDNRYFTVAGSSVAVRVTYHGRAKYKCICACEQLRLERCDARWLSRVSDSNLYALKDVRDVRPSRLSASEPPPNRRLKLSARVRS